MTIQQKIPFFRVFIPAIIALLFILFSVIPFSFSPTTKIYVPLVLIVIYYFAIFRPSVLNVITVFFLGILTDLLLSVPFGLNAFFFVLVFFIANLGRSFLLDMSFNGLWISFAALMFAVDLLWYLFSCLISGEWLFLSPFILQYILLVLFCPLIISFCCWLNIKLGYKS